SPCRIATRIGISQIDLQHGARADAQHVLVALWKKFLGVLIVGESLFECRGGHPIANAFCEIAQVQALAAGIERAEESLKPTTQILGANEERLGGRLPRLDEAYRRWRGNRGEGFFVARPVQLN